MSKYTAMGWVFLFLAVISSFFYEGVREDINFYGLSMMCVICIIADMVIRDLKK